MTADHPTISAARNFVREHVDPNAADWERDRRLPRETITREINAPIQRVWEAITNADEVRQWWAEGEIAAQEGDGEMLDAFYRSWCQYDWPGADVIAGDGARGHYRRTRTLSRGDPVCDMCWIGRAPKNRQQVVPR